jgi:S-adenosylmethionine:tRNA ribosyltransferase-isomerase
MLVRDFDFPLPGDLIAQDAAPRGTSRLLVLDRATGRLEHAAITDLARLLRPGDVLVVNNSRVFAARLLGRRVPTGGAVECLLLAPVPDTPPRDGEAQLWSALVHPGQKLKPGALMAFAGEAGVLNAEVLERHFQGRRTIRLWSDSGRPITELIDALGHVPLPPYIARADTIADRERYQTVFARVRGSIAAPTAGLHFTAALLDDLQARGIARAEITLHVGYGTFMPVKVDRVQDHVVDAEPYTIGPAAADLIARARADGRRVIAVGTTTTRALEDAARRGHGAILSGSAQADLFIYPGFEFHVVSGLVTNFHLPKSSLLMLASAFAGVDRVLEAYREAVAARYRFYSYGDAMLIV